MSTEQVQPVKITFFGERNGGKECPRRGYAQFSALFFHTISLFCVSTGWGTLYNALRTKIGLEVLFNSSQS